LDITIQITGDLTVSELDDSSDTKIIAVKAEANCASEEFSLTSFETNLTFAGGILSTTFSITKPDCGDDEDVFVAVMTDLYKLGGTRALDELFPAPAMYRVFTDAGSDVDASYFDVLFEGPGPLTGLTIDGYCVDVGHFIYLDTLYPGSVYNYMDPALNNTNINKPENMDAVAWLINNYVPGVQYSKNVSGSGEETYLMTSGTIQVCCSACCCIAAEVGAGVVFAPSA
jgi:hypothetical protein